MTTEAVVTNPTPRQRALHIATLGAFAIAQPLLALLPKRDVFLHDFQPRWPEMIGLVVILIVVLPALCVLLDRFVSSLTKTRHRWARDAVVCGLAFLFASSVAKALFSNTSIDRSGLAWVAYGVMGTFSAWLCVFAYRRFHLFQQFLSVSSIAFVMFPVSFLWSIAPAIQRVERSTSYQVRTTEHPIPVVMIVFDEFCGLALQNENREIDAVRFPNFARLARRSTWYRNATSNHGRTANALPSILTGLLRPNAPDEPSATDLFQLVRHTNQYEMAVFEPVTRLCSEDINPRRAARRPIAEQVGILCHVLSRVYPHLVLANDFPVPLPEIPRDWFGLHSSEDERRGQKRGLFRYNWAAEREIQVHHFTECLRRGDKPLFAFEHVALPHYPWCFLPNGDHYVLENQTAEAPNGTTLEHWTEDPTVCRQACERYLLQLGFVDHAIGQVLNQLKRNGLLDECLLIVTADHGVSFEPGHSRRKPEAKTIGDILAIPLFIKLPGQRAGQVSDRNVESIDLLPTIADVLGLQIDHPTDGSSLISQTEAPRPRKVLLYDDDMTVLEPQPQQLRQRFEEFWQTWRPGTPWESWETTASRPELLGREVQSFRIESNPELQFHVFPARSSSYAENSEFYPRFVMGEFTGDEESHFDVVCAADGVLCAATPLTDSDATSHKWSVLLPAELATRKSTELEFFLWDERKPEQLLRFPGGRIAIEGKTFVRRLEHEDSE